MEACRIAENYGGDLSEEYEEMCDVYNAEKMYDKASECGLTADLMDEIIIKAKYVRAKALFRVGMRDEAIHEINFEMKLDLGNHDERHILTMILSEMCYMEDADSTDVASIAHMHGEMFRDFWSHRKEYKEKLKERLKTADLAVDMRGNEANNHAVRAKILFDMENYLGALEAIIEALSLNPFNARCHYVKAEVLRKLGRMPECRKEAKEARALDPDDREARALDPDDREARALDGFCLYKEGRRERGICDGRRRHTRKDPGSQMTCYYMAYVTFKEGERGTALDICKVAVLHHPEKQELRFLLAAMLEDVLEP